VISRLDSISATRFELRSELGHFEATGRQEFIERCVETIVPFHRYTDFELVVHPSAERYGLNALAEDPTGFSFYVEELRRAGDRIWAILQDLAREYRERGIVIATSVAGPI
jgi:hypothetical protein